MAFSFRPVARCVAARVIAFTVLALPVLTLRAGADIPQPPQTPERQFAGVQKKAWATGLRDPQGLARGADGKIFVAETGAGQVVGYSPDGAKLGAIGEGLKDPCGVVFARDRLFIAERGANRVLRLEADGTLTPLPVKLNAPAALTSLPGTDFLISVEPTRLLVASGSVSDTESASGDVLYTPPAEARRPDYRAATVDRDGEIYISDAASGSILLLTARGRIATWATGLKTPSGIAIAQDGGVYVCEEGAGRLVKLSAEGKILPVLDGLGKPHDLVFTDAKTLLVSDRKSGTLWAVTLP